MTHECPICHLRFRFASELDAHGHEDHVDADVPEQQDRITRYRDERPPPTYVTPSI